MAEAMFSQELWAESWERRGPLIEHLVPAALRSLAPVPGERILDVGTGLGPLAIAAAQAVEPAGRVVAVDISRPVLDRAHRHAEAAGVSNLEFRLLDAETATIPGGPFDAATSLLGVMFFANPAGAFSNIRRQLRPGGRVAFVAWAGAEANRLLAEVMLDDFAPGGLVHAGRGSFSLADPGRFRNMLERAGFEDIRVTEVALVARATAAELFDDMLLDVYRVLDERKPAARLHVQETLRASEGPRGFDVPLAVHIATASSGRRRREG